MARLSEQLKYFVNKKVSEDANWRGVEIVLSGHDVRRPPFFYPRWGFLSWRPFYGAAHVSA
jgi:hypothetical protein